MRGLKGSGTKNGKSRLRKRMTPSSERELNSSYDCVNPALNPHFTAVHQIKTHENSTLNRKNKGYSRMLMDKGITL